MPRSLALIQARNLVEGLSVPAFLVDADGRLAFYNEAAGHLVGKHFGELGPLPREQWNRMIGPIDEEGRPMASDGPPLMIALREGRPGYGRYRIRTAWGQELEIETSVLPLRGPAVSPGCSACSGRPRRRPARLRAPRAPASPSRLDDARSPG